MLIFALEGTLRDMSNITTFGAIWAYTGYAPLGPNG